MSVYLPERFDLYERSYEIGELVKQLLEVAGKRSSRINHQLLQRAAELIEQTGLAPEHIGFVRDLATRLEKRRFDNRVWDDLAFVVQILAQVDFRLKSYVSSGEPPQPKESAKERYRELASAFRLMERPEERHTRSVRRKAIRDALAKRPGLYITELHRELTRFKEARVTYQTIWDDVRSMETKKELITVGGPQGSRRYCFVHPASLGSRRAYYDNYFGLEGVIERKLTNSFAISKTWVDLFLVNSSVKPLIVVTEYGVTPQQILGASVKTFGRLHQFPYLREHFGAEPRQSIPRLDVLRAYSLSTVKDNEEKVLWYDRQVLSGGSLYSGDTTVGM